MAQVTGIVFVKVNGSLQRSKEGAKLMLGGKERTEQTGHSVYGYSEKVVPAEVEFTLAHTSDDDLIALRDITDGTINFETDSGQVFVVGGAFLASPPELTGGEGDVALTFKGNPAEQL